MRKKLYKSRNDRVIQGVCGGISEYINADPTVVRVVYVVVSLLSANIPGVLLYLILSIVMPNKDEVV